MVPKGLCVASVVLSMVTDGVSIGVSIEGGAQGKTAESLETSPEGI